MSKLTSSAADVWPLFTQRDIQGMSKAFNYDDVKAHGCDLRSHSRHERGCHAAAAARRRSLASIPRRFLRQMDDRRLPTLGALPTGTSRASGKCADFQRTYPHVEPRLSRTRLCFPGIGNFAAETQAPKMHLRPCCAFGETARHKESPPLAGICRPFGKSPVARECVVDDAVDREPVSAPNSLLTGKIAGKFA
jgi:hypothetical protein